MSHNPISEPFVVYYTAHLRKDSVVIPVHFNFGEIRQHISSDGNRSGNHDSMVIVASEILKFIS